MSSRITTTLIGALLCAGALIFQSAPASAQEESNRSYKVDAEAGASVFFGATSQTTVILKTSGDYHGWERFLLGGRIAYDYGEAQDDQEVTFVNKRSWIGEAQLDYLPGGNWSPFVLGSVEGSLERKIERRYAGAAGVRWTPLDEDGKKFDLAGGAKIERTTPKVDVGEVAETESIGRLYTRGEVAWPLGENLAFSLITTYEPDFSDFNNYTVGVDTGIQFNFNSAIALKLSLLDRYDSSAKSRGALSNNDGRLFFSIIAAVS